jgi:competence protein ComEC
MGILSFLIVSAWWKASGKALIGLTLIILTVIEPLSPLYDAGFWLSFGATLGIVLFQNHTKWLFTRLKVPEMVSSVLALTVWASLWSLPILIFHFWNITVNTVLTNVLISWFVGWILFSGSIFWILSLLWFPFLKMAWILVYIPTKIIITLSKLLSNGIVLHFSVSSQIWISCFLLGVMLYYFIFDELHLLNAK